jgi:hypothetical protein
MEATVLAIQSHKLINQLAKITWLELSAVLRYTQAPESCEVVQNEDFASMCPWARCLCVRDPDSE